jgi:hypothetical protein
MRISLERLGKSRREAEAGRKNHKMIRAAPTQVDRLVLRGNRFQRSRILDGKSVVPEAAESSQSLCISLHARPAGGLGMAEKVHSTEKQLASLRSGVVG